MNRHIHRATRRAVNATVGCSTVRRVLRNGKKASHIIGDLHTFATKTRSFNSPEQAYVLVIFVRIVRNTYFY